MNDESRVGSPTAAAGHEPDSIPLLRIALAAGGLLLTVLLALGVTGMLDWLLGTTVRDGAEHIGDWPAEEVRSPQPDQTKELARVRDKARRRLNSYEWSGEEQDAARIPLTRAMELLVEQEAGHQEAQEEPDPPPPAAEGEESP